MACGSEANVYSAINGHAENSEIAAHTLSLLRSDVGVPAPQESPVVFPPRLDNGIMVAWPSPTVVGRE